MPGEFEDEAVDVAESISRALQRLKQTVATAESLTSGNVAARLGAAESASEWFCGGVVTYTSEAKFRALGVEPGPVVTRECAEQMAKGAAELIGSDFSVALTGVGGPDEEEGQPVGTVFFAVHGPKGEQSEEQHFAGGAEQIVRASTLHALKLLEAAINGAGDHGNH